jgi:predicted ATPase
MLTHLRLESFKSFAKAEAPIGPFTLLIGANGSGKSNALEALRLLRALVADLSPLQHVLRHTGEIRGARESARYGSDVFTIGTRWRTTSGREVEHDITCAVRPELEIRAESLRAGDGNAWLRAKSLLPPPGAPPVGMLEWPFSDDESQVPASMTISTLTSAVLPVFSTLPQSPVRQLAFDLTETLRDLRYIDVTPSRMHEYVPVEATHLDDHGDNLSAVLCRECEDAGAKQEVLDWLSVLCAPEIEDVEFSKTDEGRVMMRVVEKGGTRVSARSLSDGTLRLLGELVAVRTANRGSVLLLEDLGRDLHPKRIRFLVEQLEAVIENRGVQVIATTHSPEVFAALGDKARGDVLVLGRIEGESGSVIRRFSEVGSIDPDAHRGRD